MPRMLTIVDLRKELARREKMLAKVRFFSIAAFPLSLLGVGLSIWLTRRNK